MATAADARTAEADDDDGSVGADAGTRNADAETPQVDDDLLTRKRTVLITGCSSGIGRAAATAFLAEDWHVVATARDLEDVTALADAGCRTRALDVTEPEQVVTVVEETLDRTGGIDCLVNNAGYARFGPVEDVTMTDLHAQFDVNLYGPHRLTRAVLPHMRSQGSGRIVNVSSLAGRISGAGMGAYAGSKHALEAMTDAMRAEVAEFGIDVVLVEPGPVETNFGERAREELLAVHRTPAYEGLYDIIEDTQLVGGEGPIATRPEAVARAIVRASTCPDPPARYPVGPVSNYGQYARFLPDRLRDAAYGLLRRLV